MSLKPLPVLRDFVVQFLFSCEDSVQEPFAGFVDAEKPEAFSIRGFDVEVVAGFFVATPPFAADALGADGVTELVYVVSMTEEDGSAVAVVGGGDHDFDLDRLCNKLERTGVYVARVFKPCIVLASTG